MPGSFSRLEETRTGPSLSTLFSGLRIRHTTPLGSFSQSSKHRLESSDRIHRDRCILFFFFFSSLSRLFSLLSRASPLRFRVDAPPRFEPGLFVFIYDHGFPGFLYRPTIYTRFLQLCSSTGSFFLSRRIYRDGTCICGTAGRQVGYILQ